jgi:hypothetical protein
MHKGDTSKKIEDCQRRNRLTTRQKRPGCGSVFDPSSHRSETIVI